MSSTPTTIGARVILDMAVQLDADERRVKQKLIACAKAHEFDMLVQALERWLEHPPGEVLATLDKRGLDPCGGSEVKDKRP